MYFETITEYISHIIDGFFDEEYKMRWLCELRSVSLKGGRLPNYTHRVQALQHCLRYRYDACWYLRL